MHASKGPIGALAVLVDAGRYWWRASQMTEAQDLPLPFLESDALALALVGIGTDWRSGALAMEEEEKEKEEALLNCLKPM